MNVGVSRKCKRPAGDPDLAGDDLAREGLAGDDLAGDMGVKDSCVNPTDCLVGDLVDLADALPSAAQTPRVMNDGVEDVNL